MVPKTSYTNPPRTMGDAPIPPNKGDYAPIEIECVMDSPAEDMAEGEMYGMMES